MPRLPEDVVLIVAGDGPDRGRIEEAIESRALSGRVRLLGAVSDREIEALYQGADVYVMPNVQVPGDMEGFGLVMLEAGLCGLPVVASDIEGIPDVITEGENGHLVESGNAAEFARALVRYRDDPGLRAAASGRARAHTVARFGWDGVVERIIDTMTSRTVKPGQP